MIMPGTKIIATLGPASNNYTTLRKMFTAGLDVVRLNFSHGSLQKHLECIELVRRLNKKYRRHIRIMQDLEGFRIRVGRFKHAKEKLKKQRTIVRLTNNPVDDGPKTIPLDYEGDLSRLKPEQFIYIDDGKLALEVKTSSAGSIKTVVVEGGILKERKGINIPDVDLSFDEITDKDKKSIEFGIKHSVDYIALSFVRCENDVRRAAAMIKPALPDCR